MKTWECINSVLWETWGDIKICRECGYPQELKTFDGHEPTCTLGKAAKVFASSLRDTQHIRESNREERLKNWGIELLEEEAVA